MQPKHRSLSTLECLETFSYNSGCQGRAWVCVTCIHESRNGNPAWTVAWQQSDALLYPIASLSSSAAVPASLMSRWRCTGLTKLLRCHENASVSRTILCEMELDWNGAAVRITDYGQYFRNKNGASFCWNWQHVSLFYRCRQHTATRYEMKQPNFARWSH